MEPQFLPPVQGLSDQDALAPGRSLPSVPYGLVQSLKLVGGELLAGDEPDEPALCPRADGKEPKQDACCRGGTKRGTEGYLPC